ncbi:MAG: PEGA domain-containing protein [Candidatus Roizmanbacteria bacterium]
MNPRSIFKNIFYVVFFVLVLSAIVLYGRGYRPNITKQGLDPTGIIVASSAPDGAKIYINGDLHGATNENITLPPGNYHVKITKDGFSAWEKDVNLKGEWAVKTNAVLYPLNPSLSPITSIGILKAVSSQTGEKTVFVSQTGDPLKDGIYQLNNTKKTLSLGSQLKLLALKSSFSGNADLSSVSFDFSPDEQQVLITTYLPTSTPTPSKTNKLTKAPTPVIDHTYLLSLTETKQTPFDVTNSVASIKTAWQKETATAVDKLVRTLKTPIQTAASSSFEIASISPDGKKILYKATTDATIPLVIDPPLPGSNQTQESRSLHKNSVYIYDKEEDKNFELTSVPITASIEELNHVIFWHPNSQNLIVNDGTNVSVVDYDNTNKRTVYSGPYELTYLAISDQGDLLILANLNPKINQFPDIYSVGIR